MHENLPTKLKKQHKKICIMLCKKNRKSINIYVNTDIDVISVLSQQWAENISQQIYWSCSGILFQESGRYLCKFNHFGFEVLTRQNKQLEDTILPSG